MRSPKRRPVVAIDGPSGVGKTTVSRLVARRLSLSYIDTGAMYRAVALRAEDDGIDLTSDSELERFCKRVDVCFDTESGRIFVDGEDYTDRIRSPRAGELASMVSARKPVREFLVGVQREAGKNGGVVMEGRDIGTVVFPDADVKFFLDASPSERTRRRYLELAGKNPSIRLEDVEREMEERDRRDTSRDISPLRRAGDAIYIDTTGLTIEEVVERIVNTVKERPGYGDICC